MRMKSEMDDKIWKKRPHGVKTRLYYLVVHVQVACCCQLDC